MSQARGEGRSAAEKSQRVLGTAEARRQRRQARQAEEAGWAGRSGPVEVIRHNHVTRDIKAPGKCPACDRTRS